MSALDNPAREPLHVPRWRAFMLVVAAGLVLAGIVHIIAVLLIPRFASNDAYALLAERGRDGHAELVDPGETRIIAHDPSSAIGVCGYDLADGPLRVSARRGGLPLAITLHQPGGGVFYAVTDRAAVRDTVAFTITTRGQMAERIAQEDEGEVEREFRVLAPSTQGLVVTRVLVRRDSERKEAEALATATTCTAAD